MRIGIGIAVVVAIGLIWSVAVMSQWVPVASAEMRSRSYPALRGWAAQTGSAVDERGRSPGAAKATTARHVLRA